MEGMPASLASDTRIERLSRGDNPPCDPAARPHLAKFIAAGIWALLAPAPTRSRSPVATTTTTPRRPI